MPPSVAAQIKGALGRDTIKSGVKARLKIARARLDLVRIASPPKVLRICSLALLQVLPRTNFSQSLV